VRPAASAAGLHTFSTQSIGVAIVGVPRRTARQPPGSDLAPLASTRG